MFHITQYGSTKQSVFIPEAGTVLAPNLYSHDVPLIHWPGYRRQHSDSLVLDGTRIESWWSASFSPHVQTSPGAHPASSTRSPSREVKRQGRGVDHPPPSSVEVQERVDLHLSFPHPDLRGLFYGELYLTLPFILGDYLNTCLLC